MDKAHSPQLLASCVTTLSTLRSSQFRSDLWVPYSGSYRIEGHIYYQRAQGIIFTRARARVKLLIYA